MNIAPQSYQQDFYAWTIHNAWLLRQGKLSEIDHEHIAEELEGMARSEKRQIANRLAVLLAHLLKWEHQPTHRSGIVILTYCCTFRGITPLRGVLSLLAGQTHYGTTG